MVILIPWKPVVVCWCLIAAMLWVGYIGYSVVEGKNPFAMAHHRSSRVQTNDGVGHDHRTQSTGQ